MAGKRTARAASDHAEHTAPASSDHAEHTAPASSDQAERTAAAPGEPAAHPLSGRRAQAARNDERILEAAREVFLADPGAPISAVAERAGVGIGALYRRHASKDELLQRLAADGMERYLVEV